MGKEREIAGEDGDLKYTRKGEVIRPTGTVLCAGSSDSLNFNGITCITCLGDDCARRPKLCTFVPCGPLADKLSVPTQNSVAASRRRTGRQASFDKRGVIASARTDSSSDCMKRGKYGKTNCIFASSYISLVSIITSSFYYDKTMTTELER